MSRRHVVLAVLLCASALSWHFDARARDAEATVRVELACSGDTCEARVDGGDPLSVVTDHRPRAGRLGVYVYHPWERDAETRFRDLEVRRPEGLAPYRLSLTELDHAGWFDGGGGERWRLLEGDGMAHRGEPGSRGVALLAPPTDHDFELDVTLVDPVDAGIAFRGYDADNLWLFVVRPAYNDAFFVQSVDGEPQPIAALTALRPLTVEREALRLGGLAGKLVCFAALLLGALRLAFRAAARLRPGLRAAPFEPRPLWIRATVAVLFVATVAVCASISLAWLQGIPHIEDESAYLFQARVFASGALWAAPPEHPEFFEHEHLIVQQGRWFSKYPPLFSAVLALGVWAGAAWLVNPLLAALTGWLVYRLGRELAGPWWGAVAWALLITSPFFTVMGATYMSHMLCAALTVAFLWRALVAVRRERAADAAVAGALLGLALMTRPYTAFLVALAVAPFLAARWLRRDGFRERLRLPAALLAGVAPFVLLFLAWGALHAPDGDLSFNVYAQNDPTDTLGFGPDKGSNWLMTWGSYGHTPAKALRAAHAYLEYTADHLFGWPAGLSLAFALAGAAFHRRRAEAWALAALPLALAAGYGFYWATQHLAYGARYWFAALPAVALLTALGVRSWTESGPAAARAVARPAVALLLAGFCAYNVTRYLPQRLHELPQFGGITADLAREVERVGIDGGLVFVRTQGVLFNDGFHLNDPSDPAATLFARDLGADNEALRARYPQREAWRWDGRRLTPLDPLAERRP